MRFFEKTRVLIVILSLGLFSFLGEAKAGTAPTGFTDELIVGGLNLPTCTALLPDGRMLITEQNTRDIVLVIGSTLHGSVLNIADVRTTGNERGLLSIAVDPNWPTDPYIYTYFSRNGGTNYLTRYTASGDLSNGTSTSLTFGDRYDILTDIPDIASNHNGGTLRFGPDDMLYLSIGDDAVDPCDAQETTNVSGTVLRLNVAALPSGAGGPASKSLIAAPGNPWINDANDNTKMAYCLGLRNPFKMSIDPDNGDVFLADVGQSDFEEVSLARGGENFGWPFREANLVRTQFGCTEPGGSGNAVYDPPIAFYDRSGFGASIIMGVSYRQSQSVGGQYLFPSNYEGVVFYNEYYQGFVRAIEWDGNAWVPFSAPGQPNATDWGTGFDFVSDWMQHPDGAVYYLEQLSGQLRRLTHPGSSSVPGDGLPIGLRAAPNPLRAGQNLQLQFTAPTEGPVSLSVFDVEGRALRTLSGNALAAGELRMEWDGKDANGRQTAPGVYFLKLTGPNWSENKRITVLP